MTSPRASVRAYGSSIATVVHKELIRSSRRWQTHGLRAGFVAVLLVLVAVYWSEGVSGGRVSDRAGLADLGRSVFRFYSWTLWIALGLVTPVFVSQGLATEREGGTLDLLVVTRLSPGQILCGKLVARVLGLELLVLAGMPLLAICTSLGGMELTQLAGVWLQCTTLILSLGVISAFVSVYSDSPFSALIVSWTWALGAWTIGTVPFAVMRLERSAFAWISPPMALHDADPGTMWGPLLTCLPMVAFVLLFTASAFAARIGGGDLEGRSGRVSPETKAVSAQSRQAVVIFFGLVAVTPLVIAAAVIGARMTRSLGRDFPLAGGAFVPWFWAIGWLLVGTLIYLMLVRLAYVARDRARARVGAVQRRSSPAAPPPTAGPPAGSVPEPDPAPPVGKPPAGALLLPAGGAGPESKVDERVLEAQEWGATLRPAAAGPEPPAPPDPAAPEPAAAPSVSPAPVAGRRRFRRRFFRAVWRNPVAWRETVTRAHGSLNTFIAGGYFLLVFFAVLVLFLAVVAGDPKPGFAASVTCYLGAVAIAVITSASSIAGEIRAQSFEPLCVTSMSGSQILAGKLFSTMILAGPALLGAVLTMILGVGVVADVDLHRLPSLDVQVRLLGKWMTITTWMVSSTLGMAALSHGMAMRVRSASRVWISTALWTVVLLVVPASAAGLWAGNLTVEAVVTLINPLVSPEFWDPGAPPLLGALSVLVWSALTVALFLSNGRQLLRRAMEA